ncbi:MAG TPA: TerB family tellurite resistance protein [Rhodocyclaceae bacterium]
MRKYSIDSEAATSRILAAALLADGALNKSELDLIDRHYLIDQLGISAETLDRAIHEFCDDMNQYARRDDCGDLDLGRQAIDGILDEIRDRNRQKALLSAIIEIVCADRQVSSGEAALASQAMLRWSISPQDIGYELHPFSPRWPKQFDRASMGVTL